MNDPLDRATAFVRAHGPAFELALMDTLGGRLPGEALEQTLAALQHESGGFAPARAGDAGAGPVQATLSALSVLDAFGRPNAPPVARAASFLGARQQPDGSWAEPDDAPEPARIRLTAAVCGRLARTRHGRASVLERGGAWLERHWDLERLAVDGLPGVTAWFEACASQPLEIADEALQWCGRELEKGFRAGVFDALGTARVFVACGARALPATRLEAAELVPSLLALQQQDGGWPGADPAERVRNSVDACIALARFTAV